MLELVRAIIGGNNEVFYQELANTTELTSIQESHRFELSSTMSEELAANLRDDYLPIHIAAAVGNIEALQALQAKFPDSVFIQNSRDGYTPLHVAAQYDEVGSVVRAILAHRTPQDRMTLLQIQDISRHTPLHKAAYKGTVYSVKAMLEAVEYDERITLLLTQDPHKTIPLHWAVKHNKIDSVKEMLEKAGSRAIELLLTKDIYGIIPLNVAIYCSNADMVKEILKSVEFHEDMMELLLTQYESDGMTPLHWAVKHNKIDSVEYLLKAGGHRVSEILFAKNKNGDTALNLIARHGEIDFVIKILEAAGFDNHNIMETLTTPNERNTTLLDEAVQFVLTLSILQRLVEQGFDEVKNTLMSQDHNSNMLIHEASKPFSPGIVREALDKALVAWPNFENVIEQLLLGINGNTSLHQSALYGVVTSLREKLNPQNFEEVILLFEPSTDQIMGGDIFDSTTESIGHIDMIASGVADCTIDE